MGDEHQQCRGFFFLTVERDEKCRGELKLQELLFLKPQVKGRGIVVANWIIHPGAL